MKRDRLPYILIPLVALVVILPLLAQGCSCGHDFDFHLINWFEIAHQFQHGTLHPQWAVTPAWNAGEPRFVFYPPLSWYLGAALGVLIPWGWTPIVYTWLVVCAAGFALHFAARELKVSTNGALIAAAVYMVNPYMLFTAYERTAYAELLAAVWIPLLLVVVLRERITVLRIAVPVALLWLTNAPAAVMGCYALALLAALRLLASMWNEGATQTRADLAAKTAGGAALGLGLAAFYIVPAAYERRWVQIKMAMLPGMAIGDNFLFHHTTDPDHDKVLRTASIVAIIVIALTLVTTIAAARKAGWMPLLRVLGVLSFAIAFLLTPFSAPIWDHTPELPFLQFPWRLLAILAAIFALTLSHAFSRISTRSLVIASILCAIALTLPTYAVFKQECDPEDTVAARLAVFRSSNPGTDPTDEYTPNTADNDSLAKDNPPYWLVRDANDAPAKAVTQSPGPAPHRLDLDLTSAQTIVLNLRRYPAWEVRVNGAPAEIPDRNDGLIAIPLPPGPAHITIRWVNGRDHLLGDSVSVIALLIVAGLLVRWREAPPAA
jgi:uncharacterized membrane protein